MLKNLLILSSFIVLTACQSVPVKIAEREKTDLPVIFTIDNDTDQDGVLDDTDQCPNTPMNVVVDYKGCPVVDDCCIDYRPEFRSFYEKNTSYPDDKYQVELKQIAEKMQEFPNAIIKLEGHASKAENDKHGKGISRERVLTIKQLLKEKYSIADDRIETESYGAERPIASNATDEGRKMNQRVYGVITGRK